jgi:hypothetical protein
VKVRIARVLYSEETRVICIMHHELDL